MIVTMVRFPESSEPIGLEEARQKFGGNAASYLDVPGLLFKAYLRSEDGRRVGGVYWWRDRKSADEKFNEGWRAGMIEKYGNLPEIEYFDAPVAVDPRSGAVFTEAP